MSLLIKKIMYHKNFAQVFYNFSIKIKLFYINSIQCCPSWEIKFLITTVLQSTKGPKKKKKNARESVLSASKKIRILLFVD